MFKSVDSAGNPIPDKTFPISAFKQRRSFELVPSRYVHPDTLEPLTPVTFTIPNLIRNTGTTDLQWLDSAKVITSNGSTIVVNNVLPNPTKPGQSSSVSFTFRGGLPGATALPTISFTDEVCRDLVRSFPLTFYVRPNPPTITAQNLAGQALSAIDAGRFLCQTAPKDTTIRLYNSGQKPLVITSAAITQSGSATSDFQVINPPVISQVTPLVVAAENTTTLTVRYTPRSTGQQTATLRLLSNAANAPSTSITLSAVRDSTALALSAALVDFGQIEEGAPSVAPQTFTIRNAGSVPVTLAPTQTVGQFTIQSITPTTLAPGASATATVNFTGAAASGAYNNKAAFADACGKMYEITLNANVFKPLPSIGVASPIAFGTLTCEAVTTLNVPITNVTRANGMDLTVRRVALAGRDAGEFQLGARTVPFNVPPNQSITIPLVFSPRSAGTKQAQVIIESNATNVPNGILTVDIAATKDSVSFALSRSRIDWNSLLPGASATDTLTIANTGTKTLAWNRTSTITVNPPGQFSIEGVVPQPDGRTLVTVRFTGSSVNQAAQAVFTDECGKTQSLSLNATILPPRIKAQAVQPFVDQTRAATTNGAAVGFNDLLCEPSAVAQFELQNIGGQDLLITELRTNNTTFEILNPPNISQVNPIRLANGRTQIVQVRFAPRGLQDSVVFAPMTISSNAVNGANGSTTATLAARKDFLDYVVLGDSVGFAPVPPNTPATATFTLINNGTVPLQWQQTPFVFDSLFRLVSITPPITPRNGRSTATVEFRGAPSSNNGANYKAQSSISSAVGASCERTRSLQFAATVLDATATLELGRAEAEPGKFVEIPVYLRNGKYLRESQATDFLLDVRHNYSLIVPQDNTPLASGKGQLQGKNRVLPLRLPIANAVTQGRDTILARLKYRATLGSDTAATLHISNLRTLGTPLTVVKLDTIPGLFKLTGLCLAGGTRLFSDEAATAVFSLARSAPNPATDKTVIHFSVIETGQTTLSIYNVLGAEVKRLLDGELAAGTYQLEVDVSSLQAGAYFYTLQTPTLRTTQRMEVVK